MKTKMLFGVSLAVNVILLFALVFLFNNAFRLPDYTPPLVRFLSTNAPPIMADAAGRGQPPGLRTNTGFDTNSVNATR